MTVRRKTIKHLVLDLAHLASLACGDVGMVALEKAQKARGIDDVVDAFVRRDAGAQGHEKIKCHIMSIRMSTVPELPRSRAEPTAWLRDHCLAKSLLGGAGIGCALYRLCSNCRGPIREANLAALRLCVWPSWIRNGSVTFRSPPP